MGTILYFLFLSLFLLLYFPVLVFVWLVTYPFDPKKVVLNKATYVLSMMIIHICPFWRVEVVGKEKIDRNKNYVIASNHQSMLDISLLANLPLNFKWVSKKEVYKMPVIGWVLWLRDDVAIERGGLTSTKKMLAKCKKFLDMGLSIAIFPEGTRSKTGRVEQFKEGAFIVAKSGQVPILPVVVDGTWGVANHLGFGLKMPSRLRITVLDPIPAEEVKRLPIRELSQLTYDKITTAYRALAAEQYSDEL